MAKNPTVLQFLSENLGDELAKDLIAHRRGIKCPLTLQGAKNIIAEYKRAGNVAEMCQYHLNMGWRGFNHAWVRSNRNFRDEHNPAPIKPSANYGNPEPVRPPEPKSEEAKERVRQLREMVGATAAKMAT